MSSPFGTQGSSSKPNRHIRAASGSPFGNSDDGRASTSQTNPHSKNKQWVAGGRGASPALGADGSWDRGTFRGGRGRGRGRGRGDGSGRASLSPFMSPKLSDETDLPTIELENTTQEREKTWEELTKAREEERERAIREGKMDDPTKPKRLEEAITMVGTCQDMCPEYERYRREMQSNLDRWEMIMDRDGKPTKKVDHKRAVKIYERGQGDKIIPSDLRPAPVLKRTLDYLFHDLIPRGGFADTQAFVRDRSRAVRNDFTIQQDTGPVAMECHERCTRFHILSLHLMYGNSGFDRALEIQQCMNSLLSLKEFYDDQREVYQSRNELEMRIYHRLGLIRDQHERNDKPPSHIASDRAFLLMTRFRAQIQNASAPITKTSKLNVSAEAMSTFGELAGVLRERGNVVMVYLVACFLEHIFGKGTIEDMEAIVDGLSIQDIVDGNEVHAGGARTLSSVDGLGRAPSETMGDGDVDIDVDTDLEPYEAAEETRVNGTEAVDELDAFIGDSTDGGEDNAMEDEHDQPMPSPLKRGATQWLNDNFGGFGAAPAFPASQSAPGPSASVFGDSQPHHPSPSPVATTNTAFSTSSSSPFLKVPQVAANSVFGKLASSSSAPSSVFGSGSVFGQNKNVFGGPVFGVNKPQPQQTFTPPVPSPSLGPTNATQPSTPNLFTPSSNNYSSTPGSGPSGQKRSFSSLADQPALSSEGEHDKPSSPFVVKPDSPFATSKSMSTLNPGAPSFSPFGGQRQDGFSPAASASAVQADSSQSQPLSQKPTLTPLRTDALSFPPPTETPSLLRERTEQFQSVQTPTSHPSFQQSPGSETPSQTAPLRINTGVGLGLGIQSTGFIRKTSSIDSPVGPPPLNRAAPISLPGTPTATTQSPPSLPPTTPGTSFDGSNPLLFGANNSPFRRFPGLAQGGAAGPSGMSSSKTEPALSTSSVAEANSDGQSTMPTSRSDGFNPAKRLRFSADEDEVEEADSFRQRCLVTKYLKVWKERSATAAMWKEAVQRSDVYKEKSARDQKRFVHVSPPFKRERETSNFSTSSSEPQRLKRRLKSQLAAGTRLQIRTDSMLAKRLQENKEENERRWERGTFLNVLNASLHSRRARDGVPDNWRTWLCTNSESEQTSVWLEQKFKVPESGVWESDTVFAIFCNEKAAGQGYPGLILFECISLDGLTDEIEKKYRILDDCTRLRQIMASIGDDQHYIPSLLLLSWDGKSSNDLPNEFLEMIHASQKQEKILDYRIHPLTTTNLDLDGQFAQSIEQLDLDLDGLLVEKLLLSDLFERFAQPWLDEILVWIEVAGMDDECDWRLLGHVLGSYFALLQYITQEVSSLWGYQEESVHSLPLLQSKHIHDAESILMAFRVWLQSPELSDIPLAQHLSSFDFSDYTESRAYLTQICTVFLLHLQSILHDSNMRRHLVPKARLAASQAMFREQLKQTKVYLKGVLKTLPRRPSRRRRSVNGNGDASMASTASAMTSPSPPPPSTLSNYINRDVGTPDISLHSASPSPSPSQTTSIAESSKSFVTAASLRALARSVLKTYGGDKPPTTR